MKIDLDIVQGIIKTQLEQFREMQNRAQHEGNEYNRAQANGGIVALEQVVARIAKSIQNK